VSFRVLAVPEDPTYNGYLLKPLLQKMLAECGRPNASITVLNNPKVQGYEHAKALLSTQIIERYRHFDLLLFLPDADGHDRRPEFDVLERHAVQEGVQLICCAAEQEVETWLLAGYVDRLEQGWPTVRSDRNVKENVFQPFLERHGDPRRVGGGRAELMAKALQGYDGLKARCPELQQLEDRIRTVVRNRAAS
jgi:hypothetical protein